MSAIFALACICLAAYGAFLWLDLNHSRDRKWEQRKGKIRL